MPDCKTSTKHFIYVNEYIFDQCTFTSIYCCEILLSWVIFFVPSFLFFLWCNFSEIIREQCWRTIRIFTEFCSFGQKVAVYLDKIEPLSVSVKNIQYLLFLFITFKLVCLCFLLYAHFIQKVLFYLVAYLSDDLKQWNSYIVSAIISQNWAHPILK